MTINSKPYYWLECDHVDNYQDGCEGRFPGDGAEFSAVMYADDLASWSSDSEWLTVKKHFIRHYCPDHSAFHCRECGGLLTSDEQDAGEYECFECMVGDVPGE